MGFDGEGIVDDRVLVVKTHFPERDGWKRFECDRLILLVRNPWDAIDSLWNMALTNTHTRQLTDQVYADLAPDFDSFAMNEAAVWRRFHKYWLDQTVAPVLVVRYEDLCRDPLGQMGAMCDFIKAKPQDLIARDSLRNTMYEPRAGGGNPGKALKRFSPSQALTMATLASEDLLLRFGYQYSGPDSHTLQVSPAPDGPLEVCNLDKVGLVKINSREEQGPEEQGRMVRDPKDKWGRRITRYRMLSLIHI
eukprot:TRINITY_DN29385_c0_g1_i1.p1 TRINITY_DN29385_c0_g1~~TRINITY_DN29385_c0_g1_i1.p1  ORF type:complete len:249 (-),score=32.81 TRINITY_DN29385_c0_g1_i1:150-896(-)